ncbi:RT0821/Lpp0805 family surface protein [Variovorax sp. J22P168]|uniref:RT0821/Lpp0805 family surface protein n=1 Tax=Variovorax jilinensis TaxID=3053513 RepID=UPI002577B44C|nr:RT0821/Lpp0805 family surface protein [Variovorax sp. J22P168]MDM0015569.1 RT0821/Lpp0805 family surface protein [Variovorax sp. J22P168]
MKASQGARVLAMAVAAMAAISAAQARPLSLFNAMRDTPVTRFNGADIDLMTRSVNRTLDTGADGVTVTWENPRTSSNGSITPAVDPEGRKNCRVARIENRHRALQNSASYLFCRSNGKSNGEWQVVGLFPTN